MAPPESVPSATVTDLATARRDRARDKDATSGTGGERGAGAVADGAERRRPRKPANRRFDAEKVERLKAEIAEGRYEIDAESVAERFIEHERNS